MLKWIDVIELMGYVTALFSVGVSYVSKIQEEKYSDFLFQNESLRKSIFSPFFSKVIMILIAIFLIIFLGQVLVEKKRWVEGKKFSFFYVSFLGCAIELLLWYLYKLTFVGAPMLIAGLIMVFSVEILRCKLL